MDRAPGLARKSGFHLLNLLGLHSPAIQAFTRDTQAPVKSARSTIWEKSLFRWGTMEAVTGQKCSGLGKLCPYLPMFCSSGCIADLPSSSTNRWPEGQTLSS